MPKKLPYKANTRIDQAVMTNEMAINRLVGILETPGITAQETYRRVGLAINELHKLTKELKAIPVEIKKELEEQKSTPAGQDESATQKENLN